MHVFPYALTQTTARGMVQKGTVVGHLLEALSHGKTLDLARACRGLGADSINIPDESEWERLEARGRVYCVNSIRTSHTFARITHTL